MKLIAEIDHERVQIETSLNEQNVRATCNERQYELSVHETEENALLLIKDGRVTEAHVDYNREQDVYEVHLARGLSYRISLINPKQLPRGARAGREAGGHSSIVAPMPGKVVSVLVENGAEVQAGDGVLVVEAMKMQNEMKAPKAGRITELRVASGATVNAGEVLAVIE
jgi:biotin carboxyl carrier protein